MTFGNEPYVWVLVVAGAVGIPAFASFALYSGAIAAGLGRATAIRVAVTAGTVWMGWIVAVTLLADAFRQSPTVLRPWFPLAFAGALAAPLLAARIPVVSRILAAPGMPERLAWPQTLRAIGAVFLVVALLGRLPAVFALPAGLGDFAIGISAVLVLRRPTRSGLVWLNVLGIVDLVVAVSLGFLAGLGPTQVLHVSPSTEAVTVLPLVLVPLTAVPLAMALHVVSLRRLYSAQPATRSPLGSASSRPAMDPSTAR